MTAGDIQTEQPLPFFCLLVISTGLIIKSFIRMDISLINMVIISYAGLICHEEDINKCLYLQV